MYCYNFIKNSEFVQNSITVIVSLNIIEKKCNVYTEEVINGLLTKYTHIQEV